jgi:hypothetical protein
VNPEAELMLRLRHAWELPPLCLDIPETVEVTLHQCARGDSAPDIALMQLLIASYSEQETERALGSAIWDALEDRNTGTAERLGAVQKLWDGAKDMVHSSLGNFGASTRS